MRKDKDIIVHKGKHLLMFAVPYETVPVFQTLISRGLNTWDQAPPELKAFGDEVTNGKVLQDYHSQDTGKADSPKT